MKHLFHFTMIHNTLNKSDQLPHIENNHFRTEFRPLTLPPKDDGRQPLFLFSTAPYVGHDRKSMAVLINKPGLWIYDALRSTSFSLEKTRQVKSRRPGRHVHCGKHLPLTRLSLADWCPTLLLIRKTTFSHVLWVIPIRLGIWDKARSFFLLAPKANAGKWYGGKYETNFLIEITKPNHMT